MKRFTLLAALTCYFGLFLTQCAKKEKVFNGQQTERKVADDIPRYVAAPIRYECGSACDAGGDCSMSIAQGPGWNGEPVDYWECSCQGCDFFIFTGGKALASDQVSEFLDSMRVHYPMGVDYVNSHIDSISGGNHTVDSINFVNHDTLDYYFYDVYFKVNEESEPRNVIVLHYKTKGGGMKASCDPPCSEPCKTRHARGGSVGDFSCSCTDCDLEITEFDESDLEPTSPGEQ